MMTSPGFMLADFSSPSQQPILVDFLVENICGDAHQVALRTDVPLISAETICQGGTLRFDGLEISTTSGVRSAWTIFMSSGFFVAAEIRDGFSPRASVASRIDRKSTRLNSSHVEISYAVFC